MNIKDKIARLREHAIFDSMYNTRPAEQTKPSILDTDETAKEAFLYLQSIGFTAAEYQQEYEKLQEATYRKVLLENLNK